MSGGPAQDAVNGQPPAVRLRVVSDAGAEDAAVAQALQATLASLGQRPLAARLAEHP
jgi:hypothetical protein